MEHTFVYLIATLLLGSSVQGMTITGWTWSRHLDMEGKYLLRTDVDLTSKIITFSVNLTNTTLENDVWVGIGLVSASGLRNADIIISTAENNMTDYFTTTGELLEDEDLTGDYTDWTLVDFEASDKSNFFSVERSFQVNNSTQDREIKDENSFLLWAYGNETDNNGIPALNGSSTTIGYFPVNLLRYPASAGVKANVNLLSFIPVTAIVIFASIKNIFVN